MPSLDSATRIVRNLRGQPVEVHGDDGAVVIEPYGRAEISCAGIGADQTDELVRQGFVTVTSPDPDPDPAPAPGADEDGDPQHATEPAQPETDLNTTPEPPEGGG